MRITKNSGNIKLSFSNKQNVLQKNITIVENGKITSKDSQVAEKLNKFLMEAVTNLEIEPFVQNVDIGINTEGIDDIISMYENHSSILKIKECVHVENKSTSTNSTSLLAF